MQQPTVTSHPAISFIRRHPMFSFFLFAYAGTWLVLSLSVFSTSGLGLLRWRSPPEIFYIISAITGLTSAAFIVTRACEGKEGVRRLIHRILDWRAKMKWYLLSLYGVLASYLFGHHLVGVIPMEPSEFKLESTPDTARMFSSE